MSKPDLEPFIADDPEKVREKRVNARFADKRLNESLLEMMGTKSGRHVLWWILEQAALGQDPMTGNSHTFYRLGEQAIGKKLHVAMWQASKKDYRLMQDEHEST